MRSRQKPPFATEAAAHDEPAWENGGRLVLLAIARDQEVSEEVRLAVVMALLRIATLEGFLRGATDAIEAHTGRPFIPTLSQPGEFEAQARRLLEMANG